MRNWNKKTKQTAKVHFSLWTFPMVQFFSIVFAVLRKPELIILEIELQVKKYFYNLG